MKFVLENDGDQDIRKAGHVKELAGGLAIYVNGYGNAHGGGLKAPIAYLVLQDGKLRVILSPDYTSENTETVELEGARGTRKEWDPRG